VAILIIFISNNGEEKSLKSPKKSFPLPPPYKHAFSEKAFAKLQNFAKNKKTNI
jgi:hypothetical protein